MRGLVLLFLVVVPYRVGCDSCEPILVRSTEDAGEEQPDASEGPDAVRDGGAQLFDVWLGIEGSDGRSRVQRLTFDAVANTATLALEADLTADGGPIPESWLRTVLLLPTGELLVGAANLSGWVQVDGTSMAATQVISVDSTPPLRNIHGACVSSRGSLLVGQFEGPAHEYTTSGRFVAKLSPAPRYTMVDCAATSDQRLFWVDYDGLTDANGDVVLSVLDGGTWEETARFEGNAQLAALPNSAFYALVRHSDGRLYVFPQTLGSTRNGRVLRCSSTGSLLDCALWGVELTSIDQGLGVIQGARQLPGREDILFIGANNLRLYRYDPASGTAVLVADLAAQGLSRVEPFFGIRGLEVRAR
jgi:hypothetical protein